MTSLTIIIPTYNRPQYLENLLTYLNSFDNEFEIVIADSSSQENKIKNELIIKRTIIKHKIMYLNDFSNNTNLINKLLLVLAKISTKYSVICADDDFISPIALERSVSFLENNETYTAVHGKYLGFWKENYRDKPRIFWNNKYSTISLDQKSLVKRFFFHFLNYGIPNSGFPTFYSVHKTKFLEMIFKEVSKYTDDMRFGELLLSLLTVIHGKVKYIDVLYGFRKSYDFESSGNQLLNFKSFIANDSFKYKYKKFKICLIKHFKTYRVTDDKKIDEIINYSMFLYLIYTSMAISTDLSLKNFLNIEKRVLIRYKINFFVNSKRIPFYIIKTRSKIFRILGTYFKDQKNIYINSNQVYRNYGKELIFINKLLLHSDL